MNQPIRVRDKAGERVIDLYPDGDPKLAEANQQRLHQISQAQPIIYASEPSRSHTAEHTNSRDRAWSILILAAGVLLINIPVSVGLAWAAGWGIGGWAVWFGTVQIIAFTAIYRAQLSHSPAGLERQRQEQDHELRLQQQADAHELRTKVVEQMLGHVAAQVQPPNQPQLFVRDDNGVKPQ